MVDRLAPNRLVRLDATQRAALVTAGRALYGHQCIDTVTGAVLVYNGATAGWTPPWNIGWGVVGTPVTSTTFTQAVTSSTGIDLTGLAVTFTALAGRRYEMTVSGLIMQQSVTAGTSKVFIADAANASLAMVGDAQLAASAFGSRATIQGGYLAPALTAGSTTWKIRGQTSAGTMTVQVDSATQALLLVKDIGPLADPT